MSTRQTTFLVAVERVGEFVDMATAPDPSGPGLRGGTKNRKHICGPDSCTELSMDTSGRDRGDETLC